MTDHAEDLIRAAVLAGQRRAEVPSTLWATCESYEPLTEQTTVVLDGDSIAIPVVNATGSSVATGQRVLVLFTPPKGAHIIGVRPGPPTQYVPTLGNVDVDDGTLDGWWSATNGWVDFAVVLSIGTAGSVSGTIEVGLPVPASGIAQTDPWTILGRASIGLGRWVGAGVITPSSDPDIVTAFGSDGLGAWAATVPDTWGTGDVLRVQGRYPKRLIIEDDDA